MVNSLILSYVRTIRIMRRYVSKEVCLLFEILFVLLHELEPDVIPEFRRGLPDVRNHVA